MRTTLILDDDVLVAVKALGTKRKNERWQGRFRVGARWPEEWRLAICFVVWEA
jgi:hypothetical protein